MLEFGNIYETIFIVGIPILLAITLHEAAHGFVALRFGDDTAYRLGRVTFNPFKHIDPIGTVLIPAALIIMRAPFLFGYAKPVPVDFRRLNNPKRDMIFVAAAGPGTNIFLAFLSALLLKMTVVIFAPPAFETQVPYFVGLFIKMFQFSVLINSLLAVFNMVPIPPLDGGRVAVGLLPRSMAIALARLESYGIFIVLGLLFLLPMVSASIGYPINLFQLILTPTYFIANLMLTLVGL